MKEASRFRVLEMGLTLVQYGGALLVAGAALSLVQDEGAWLRQLAGRGPAFLLTGLGLVVCGLALCQFVPTGVGGTAAIRAALLLGVSSIGWGAASRLLGFDDRGSQLAVNGLSTIAWFAFVEFLRRVALHSDDAAQARRARIVQLGSVLVLVASVGLGALALAGRERGAGPAIDRETVMLVLIVLTLYTVMLMLVCLRLLGALRRGLASRRVADSPVG